jgi:hypothetical protein
MTVPAKPIVATQRMTGSHGSNSVPEPDVLCTSSGRSPMPMGGIGDSTCSLAGESSGSATASAKFYR